MEIALLDQLVIAGYVVFVLAVGVFFARRAGQDVDQYFLSGRSLPWWMAGTSMVATTFAADTPLVITGWVRDEGIWQNWLWWCLAGGGMLTVFLFARYWRRGGVMTTAELAELRYGGREASVLRGFLGTYQALITNTIIMCWVILAAAKIMSVLFRADSGWAVVVPCLMALTYSLLAGFWGVVLTDVIQFTMAMVGALILAALSWSAIGGSAGLLEAARQGGDFTAHTLAFFPPAGAGVPGDPFWTTSLATICVYMGVAWWANDQVDGGALAVQRIAACRSERDGVYASLWYNIAHYALRPWPWIMVALASMIVLPTIEVRSPVAGRVVELREELPAPGGDTRLPAGTQLPRGASGAFAARTLVIQPETGGEPVEIAVDQAVLAADWRPQPRVGLNERVEAGDIVARTDSERAYVVMMKRFLPTGILGLAIASLLAAFMSTIDTHVNLASSFFVNDIYRRFIRPDAGPRHYVTVARLASAGTLSIAGLLAWQSSSISDLFTFFMAFLSGVGPIYVLRWLWWRVRASTEILAILTSSVTATVLTFAPIAWPLSALTPGGELSHAGRVCLVVAVTALVAFGSLLVVPAPDPAQLTRFYRRIRPLGAWGPVRALCPDVTVPREGRAVIAGFCGGLAMIYGLTLGIGQLVVGRPLKAGLGLASAAIGTAVVVRILRRSDRT